jgi:hypothetical protein
MSDRLNSYKSKISELIMQLSFLSLKYQIIKQIIFLSLLIIVKYKIIMPSSF